MSVLSVQYNMILYILTINNNNTHVDDNMDIVNIIVIKKKTVQWVNSKSDADGYC